MIDHWSLRELLCLPSNPRLLISHLWILILTIIISAHSLLFQRIGRIDQSVIRRSSGKKEYNEKRSNFSCTTIRQIYSLFQLLLQFHPFLFVEKKERIVQWMFPSLFLLLLLIHSLSFSLLVDTLQLFRPLQNRRKEEENSDWGEIILSQISISNFISVVLDIDCSKLDRKVNWTACDGFYNGPVALCKGEKCEWDNEG